MVSIYKQEKKVNAAKAIELECSGLDILGRGVCKHESLVYFVDGLMPGEIARVQVVNNTNTSANASANANVNANASASGAYNLAKDKVRVGKITKLIHSSTSRRPQICALNDQCGGCPLEHLPLEMSFQAKIEGVIKLLSKSVASGTVEAKSTKAYNIKGSARLGRNSTIKQALAHKQAVKKNEKKQQELQILAQEAINAIKHINFSYSSQEGNYRRACRLAIRADHGKLHLGFRESKTQDLVPISECMVLTSRLNALLSSLKLLVNRLNSKKQIGHVELLDSDGAVGVLLRMTCALNQDDELILKDFASFNQVAVFVLEPYKQLDDKEVVKERLIADGGGVYEHNFAQLEQLSGEIPNLAKSIFVKSKDCTLYCSPSSFVQINAQMNDKMLDCVLSQIEFKANTKVLDLFSGLGNFALPIAKKGAQVVGVDIVSNMVQLANANALLNNLADKARFFVADLEAPFERQLWAQDQYDVVVLDPGRMGAKRAIEYLAKLKPQKIVMISCNPLAAARDCTQLLKANYKIASWGAFDMFPRTTHVEIMLSFVLE